MANRTGRGQFQKGNRGGPGRPKRSVEEAYFHAATQAVPPEKVRKILTRLADRAASFDVRAAALVLRFLFGPDPVLTRRLMAELTEAIEQVRRSILANPGQPVTNGSPQANGVVESSAGPALLGPEAESGTGGDGTGLLADGSAPLFG
jgi:hypothetical protein